MPSRTAGYSGTPLPGKLGIKEAATVLLVGAPRGFRRTLGKIPPRVVLREGLRGKAPADVIVLFAHSRRDLERHLGRARTRMRPDSSLWIAWPKKASGLDTDLAREPVRDVGLAAGLVDIKVCAIDDTWSGLRFVFRSEDRA